jgi:hypothetical protein
MAQQFQNANQTETVRNQLDTFRFRTNGWFMR